MAAVNNPIMLENGKTGVEKKDHKGDSGLWRVHLGPKAGPGHAGQSTPLCWLGNALVFPWKSWKRWLGRGRPGPLCSGPHDPHSIPKWKLMDEWMIWDKGIFVSATSANGNPVPSTQRDPVILPFSRATWHDSNSVVKFFSQKENWNIRPPPGFIHPQCISPGCLKFFLGFSISKKR